MADRKCCLLAERQALIAMAMEAPLEDEGWEVVTLGSTRDAISWLASRTPDCALVSYRLKDQTCLPLARELIRRGIPFVIYTDLPRPADVPELDGVPWLAMPLMRDDLAALASGLSAASAGRDPP
jgi:DNA-binding response OmpR family regulator